MARRFLMTAALFALLTLIAIQLPMNANAEGDAPLNTAPEGWTALFNGKDIDGWEIKSGTCTYEVKDGIITGTTVQGSGNTFLCTPKEYGDFELKFDVLLHDNGLNSGVQIRSKAKGDTSKFGGRITGPQCEIEASRGQAGYIYGEATGKGWLSPEPDSKDKEVNGHEHFKNGEWNTYHIIAKGKNVKTFINGTPIADLDLPDDIATEFAKGVIGLQVHSVKGDPKWKVSWRNIYIKELE